MLTGYCICYEVLRPGVLFYIGIRRHDKVRVLSTHMMNWSRPRSSTMPGLLPPSFPPSASPSVRRGQLQVGDSQATSPSPQCHTIYSGQTQPR